MPSSVRRVVTGHDEKGKAVVLMDGKAGNVKVRQEPFDRDLLHDGCQHLHRSGPYGNILHHVFMLCHAFRCNDRNIEQPA